MLDLKRTNTQLEAIRNAADASCQRHICENDESGYYLWDKFRLDLACAISRLRDVMAYEEEDANV